MQKKNFIKWIAVCALTFAAAASAQTSLKELQAHPEYTSSNYLVYPEPAKNIKYTKAPAGFKPFYISHYGRHGSRYHHSADDYNYLYEILNKADSANKLTTQGKYLLVASRILAQKAAPRAGDLTQVGAAQHDGIAKRMVKNFPALFKPQFVKGKKIFPHVDAFASTSGRCIVSMSAFAAGLRSVAPEVDFRFESGKDLMSFICTFDWNDMDYTKASDYIKESDKLWGAVNPAPLMKKLFSDSVYVAKNINTNNFYNKLFDITSSMQGMDTSLKETIYANLCNVKTGKCYDILDSLFTVDESIARWQAQNAWWYSLQGTSPLQQTTKGINTAKGILENIISEASRVIALSAAQSSAAQPSATQNPKQPTVATLRFGHDTGLLPLAGLMQLDLANAQVTDLSKLYEQWTDFRIIPMAANLQMVFYKKPGKVIPKKAGNAPAKNKDDILVKFLYNEQEVTAPIPCSDAEPATEIREESSKKINKKTSKNKCPAAPYYRWSDVKKYYLGLIR